MKQSKGKKAKRINDLKQSGKISPPSLRPSFLPLPNATGETVSNSDMILRNRDKMNC